MISLKILKILTLLLLITFGLNSCSGGDARKISADPKVRVQKNLAEGRGIQFNSKNLGSGNFEFASSNESDLISLVKNLIEILILSFEFWSVEYQSVTIIPPP